MKIFPGMHYTMGGLWVDFNQATNIPGIYAAGECEYQYHGANRLGANSLVSCIFGGFIAGPAAVQYARNLKAAPGNGHFDTERKQQEENNAMLMKSDGKENPFRLWRELGELMTRELHRHPLQQESEGDRRQAVRTAGALPAHQSERPLAVGEYQRGLCAPALQHAATVASDCAGRGHARRIARAHYKPDFPERDDKNWLKTTKAYFAPGCGRAEV